MIIKPRDEKPALGVAAFDLDYKEKKKRDKRGNWFRDGRSVSTSDWPGREQIIGQPKPGEFRPRFVEKSENDNGASH